ncbi:M23 family metallopeptidase [Methyloceanibacter sp.]|uniref:M23 family metallopeptidase n=1 Tax=Methyloceanibacter sp. TaxID=1965321 RepID=UPI002D3AE0B6|nr:M23 family metallopeptidase [Methyloceanibacter sp.]HZP07875.1 M23 family metallopeptidase [Methyloceanibacter sp.]
MRQAFWSGAGRGACGFMAAAGVALLVAGCSSGTSSRLGSLSFNDSSGAADPSTTSSIPVPPETVYNSAGYTPGGYGGQVGRANLPPPDYTPKSASYSPLPPPDRSRIARPNYSGPIAPNGESALRADKKHLAGLHVKVGKGDTLSSLSRRYGVPVETIMGANDLSDGRLHPGQELVIPGAKAQATAQAAAPKPAAPKTAQSVAANEPEPETPADTKPNGSAEPQVHKVRTTTITPPNAEAAGQGPSLAEEEEAQANLAKAKGKPDQKTKPATDAAAASPDVTGEDAGHVATNENLPAPDPMTGATFRWPVKGRVISVFGARPDGGHNDGIDLAVPQGTAVMAAENGVVAYAGNELKGYGNLVLIRHANNWVSAYAHNEEILVKRGDKVRRGQVIAKAGATGAVSQPEVHFELRKGSRPVDPTKYMSSEAASAD